MVGEAFKFKGNGADDPGPLIGGHRGEGLHRLGEAEAISDGGVPGNTLDEKGKAAGNRSLQEIFD